MTIKRQSALEQLAGRVAEARISDKYLGLKPNLFGNAKGFVGEEIVKSLSEADVTNTEVGEGVITSGRLVPVGDRDKED